jgi:uncharacterized protein (DUF1800 family)
MVEFWSDHFNIYAYKGDGPQLKVVDDRQTIRRHALGRFRDLLGASARSAAMLGYLDNTSNRRGKPNENYARELMELHTLGVHGGYTQRDVQEVARCLTGWTSADHWRRGEFVFDTGAHDDGVKRVLGETIPAGGGVADGERVLDIVAAHPATAAHISRKLCIRFLGDAPDTVVGPMAETFRKSSGDIREVLRVLLTPENIAAAPPILKRPFDLVVSALRAFDADTDGGAGLHERLEAMGQPIFGWPMPNGYPEKPQAWTGALLPRWNFCLALAQGRIANTAIDFDSLARSGARLGQDPQSTALRLALGRTLGRDIDDLRSASRPEPDFADFAALVLMSPAFQWR